MAYKPLLLMQQEGTDCIVPVTHKLNHDGYFRRHVNGKFTMYHKYIYEDHFGPIPEGYEIHHLCNNRACCNVKHLQAVEGHAHASRSNSERYAPRRKSAYEYWLRTRCPGTELGKIFNVSFSAACKWIREWKA